MSTKIDSEDSAVTKENFRKDGNSNDVFRIKELYVRVPIILDTKTERFGTTTRRSGEEAELRLLTQHCGR